MARTNSRSMLERGRQVIVIERDALDRLAERLNAAFGRAITTLAECSGRVILTGVGKSGIIAQKITATLNSTGTAAYYMHPADALHGDLGMARRGDVMIILSKSGDTPELVLLLPAIAKLDLQIIALTGNTRGPIARAANVVLDVSVDHEACPFDLAPTASTTAMLAMGDALAVVLYETRGFTRDDFALTHPGGAIGRRLILKLADIMRKGEAVPVVARRAGFGDVLSQITGKRLGATLVTSRGRLQGIITDGDLRRLLERRADLYAMSAADMMTPEPMTAPPDMLGSAALVLLEEHKRSHLPVVRSDGRLLGVVHLHDLIEAGLA